MSRQVDTDPAVLAYDGWGDPPDLVIRRLSPDLYLEPKGLAYRLEMTVRDVAADIIRQHFERHR